MAEIIQFPSQPKPEHKPENPASAEVIPLLNEATAIECVISIDILTDDIIKSEDMSPEDLAERLRQIDDHLNTLYRFGAPTGLPPRAMVKTIAMLHQQSLPPEVIMQYPFITASLGTVRDHFARHRAEMQEAGRPHSRCMSSMTSTQPKSSPPLTNARALRHHPHNLLY